MEHIRGRKAQIRLQRITIAPWAAARVSATSRVSGKFWLLGVGGPGLVLRARLAHVIEPFFRSGWDFTFSAAMSAMKGILSDASAMWIRIRGAQFCPRGGKRNACGFRTLPLCLPLLTAVLSSTAHPSFGRVSRELTSLMLGWAGTHWHRCSRFAKFGLHLLPTCLRFQDTPSLPSPRGVRYHSRCKFSSTLNRSQSYSLGVFLRALENQNFQSPRFPLCFCYGIRGVRYHSRCLFGLCVLGAPVCQGHACLRECR